MPAAHKYTYEVKCKAKHTMIAGEGPKSNIVYMMTNQQDRAAATSSNKLLTQAAQHKAAHMWNAHGGNALKRLHAEAQLLNLVPKRL